MGIERSQAPSVQKSAEPQPNKARNNADAADKASGFAAVMQAQEPPVAPPTPEAKGAEKPAPKPAEKPAEKTAEATAHDDETKAADADDAPKSQDAAQDIAQDAAAALALVAAYLLGAPATPQPGAPGKGQPAADGKLPGIADAGAQDQHGTDAALADGAKRLASGAAAAGGVAAKAVVDARAPASSLASYASVLEQLQSRLNKGELPADEGGLPVNGIDTAATSGKPAAALSQQNARMDRLMAALQGGSGAATAGEVSKLANLASDASGALRSIDRTRGESPRSGPGNGAEGAFGQHGFTPTVQFDGGAVSAAVATQTTGDAVADQVSYFVSQGIQNAELTLDGLNAERVEVKISMSGKEAHVEFRSDQLATREMLAGTTAHLRDLLSSQGVVLTGVTVGQSGAEFSGGQQPQGRSREGQAQGRGAAADSRMVAAVAPAAAPAPAGTLDLFV